MSRIALVAFDAAGTLIELAEPVGDTYARIAAGHGVRVPAWRLGDAFARILRAAPPMAFPGAAPGEIPARERAWWRDVVRQTFRAADQMVRFEDFDACFTELFAHYARAQAWRAAPGAAEALRALAAGPRRVVVLSNFDGRLPAILAGLGLGPFEAVLLPAELGAAKPDPGFFTAAAGRLGVEPSAAVYVGDEPEHDLAAARAAGWRAIDVRASATLRRLPDLLDALEQESPG